MATPSHLGGVVMQVAAGSKTLGLMISNLQALCEDVRCCRYPAQSCLFLLRTAMRALTTASLKDISRGGAENVRSMTRLVFISKSIY